MGVSSAKQAHGELNEEGIKDDPRRPRACVSLGRRGEIEMAADCLADEPRQGAFSEIANQRDLESLNMRITKCTARLPGQRISQNFGKD